MIVEAVSKSKFWASTAIFVLEDDAQNGPDHVDSHRSPAFVISPLHSRPRARLHDVQHHLHAAHHGGHPRPAPMTHDAGARPCTPSSRTSRRHGLCRREAAYNSTSATRANAPLAARSLKLDFEEADRIDDDELNDILWLAIKGTPACAGSQFLGAMKLAGPYESKSTSSSSGTCTSRSTRTWIAASTSCPGLACTRSRTTTAWWRCWRSSRASGRPSTWCRR